MVLLASMGVRGTVPDLNSMFLDTEDLPGLPAPFRRLLCYTLLRSLAVLDGP